ncbi:MAG: Nif3-like dinuclear metal center hexameric protein [Bacteroidetes bacterium]|nr:Nif3-like dinuclear metal center hexameric protein [Bacteroidota bacterium]
MENGVPHKQDNPLCPERRIFIEQALKIAGASAMLAFPGISMAAKNFDSAKTYTVQDIIYIILKEIPGAPFSKTVDTIKSGSADQQVSGIVSTMFATVPVIEQAAKLNANFIIAHEPTFYNHEDDVHWVEHNDVLRKKRELLDKHKIAVWRFHDYWHTYRPDGVLYGVLKSTGWLTHYQPSKPGTIQIPAIKLKDLAEHFKSKLKIEHLRVIGDMNQTCERIALIPGAAGGQHHILTVEQEQPDVLVVGEVHEWETAEYIRDGRALGSKTALIVLGHAVSEEPGMEWLVEWLQPKIPELKITHITSGNPFTWI